MASGVALPPGGSVVICPKQNILSPTFWSYYKVLWYTPFHTLLLSVKTQWSHIEFSNENCILAKIFLKMHLQSELSKNWTTTTRLSWSKSNKNCDFIIIIVIIVKDRGMKRLEVSLVEFWGRFNVGNGWKPDCCVLTEAEMCHLSFLKFYSMQIWPIADAQ